jgi:hypothetical protein
MSTFKEKFDLAGFYEGKSGNYSRPYFLWACSMVIRLKT